jgi:hypothetical protein
MHDLPSPAWTNFISSALIPTIVGLWSIYKYFSSRRSEEKRHSDALNYQEHVLREQVMARLNTSQLEWLTRMDNEVKRLQDRNLILERQVIHWSDEARRQNGIVYTYMHQLNNAWTLISGLYEKHSLGTYQVPALPDPQLKDYEDDRT